MTTIVEVYINQIHNKIDTPFDYKVPTEIKDISIGDRVMVPFGVHNRNIDAIVVKVKEDSEYPRLKHIIGVIKNYPSLTKHQIDMCYWLCENYHCLFMEAVQCYIPSNLKIKKVGTDYLLVNHEKNTKYYALSGIHQNRDTYIDSLPSNATRLKEIIMNLALQPISYTLLKEQTGCNSTHIKTLLDKGFIVESSIRDIRNPYKDKNYNFPKLKLNSMQEKVMDSLRKTEKPTTFLLHGITGSGKTEIYLQMMEDIISQGKKCLYLVPEISLTSQVIERIMGRFKQNIGIIHSKLSTGEKIDQWYSIKNNDYPIVIGARSAIFAPMDNIGLIILDEEHENTYKSSNRPRYYTHDVAHRLAKEHKCHIILGSATPSIRTYYKALQGEYSLLKLTKRAKDNPLPEVSIVDMKDELYNGNRSELSVEMRYAIENNLQNKEQTILFLNKRGYASYVFCRSCGYVVKCPNCDVTMTYHINNKELLCHYCGYKKQKDSNCPTCGSNKFRQIGSGTQKLEMELKKSYPNARIIRMDSDSMQRKGAYDRAILKISKGEADILIGTQMVTKGFDFENVTLVGVILADSILNFPDFKSSERTFQLLTQVAGRAGRGIKKGRVIVQTYETKHYAIQLAKEHNYLDFYTKEIKYRQMMEYPPFTIIYFFGFADENEEIVMKDCKFYYKMIINKINELNYTQLDKEVLNPTPSPIKKINNKYRWYFIIKTKHKTLVNNLIKELNKCVEVNNMHSTRIIDINPNTMI